jgi:hypothetical protein
MDDTMLQQSVDVAQLTQADSGLMAIAGLVGLLLVASYWKIFSKAGHPEWAVIVPLYNIYVMNKIGGRGPLFLLAFCIPIVNFAAMLMMTHGISKAFGKGGLYTLGLVLAAPVFLPLLAFGDSKYIGAASEGKSTATPQPEARSLGKAA